MIFKNLIKIFTKLSSIIGFLISFGGIGYLFYYFTDSNLIIGNLGYKFFILEVALDILVAIFFGLFIAATIYKMMYFSGGDNKKNIGFGSIGSFFGIIVSGCPACSITLASYLGLASIISVLPYDGIELKVLSLLILFYVVYDGLKNLEVCKIKK